ncbi:MAG: aminotransferase class IV [Candidatus Omnitrophota bacterium]
MTRTWIILDGGWVKADEALLHRLSPGVRRLTGVFETLGVFGGRVGDLRAHYLRLSRGLKACSLQAPWTFRVMEKAVTALLEQAPGAGRLRVMVWQDGARARWALVPGAYVPPSRKEYAQGVRVHLMVTRKEFSKTDGMFKSLEYTVYRGAFEAARRRQCFETLLVDPYGQIIDGSRTNLLVLTDRALVITPAGFGTFDGLTRRRIIALARRVGLKVSRRQLFIKDLQAARAAWLTNSLIGMIPIRLFSRGLGICP